MTLNPKSGKDIHSQDSNEIDSLLRSRFELLSAYLDGEVTAAERRQVQEWLERDGEIQHQYAQLLRLRQVIQSLPLPLERVPVEETIERVFIRLNRFRFRRLVVVGGSAIAAMAIGALASVFSGSQSPVPQLARSPVTPTVEESPNLMVALNAPPIEIPKPAVAVPTKSIKPASR
jgi:anti-sigma factor RsiW